MQNGLVPKQQKRVLFHLLDALEDQLRDSLEVPTSKVRMQQHLRFARLDLVRVNVGLLEVGEEKFDWRA